MSKIGSGFMLFKALARTPSSTIVIRWWFITRCKCRFCKRLCVNVPLAGSTTKRPTKVNTRAALAATGSSDGHEAQKPIALIWRKNSIQFFFCNIQIKVDIFWMVTRCGSGIIVKSKASPSRAVSVSILPWLEISYATTLVYCAAPNVKLIVEFLFMGRKKVMQELKDRFCQKGELLKVS